MRGFPKVLPALGRLAVIGLVLALGVVMAPILGVSAQTPPAGQAPTAQPAPQAPPARVFGSDAGMIFNPVKADKTADFEMVMGKLKEALQKSDKPERKQQAASWKVFKSLEPGPSGSVLYIFVIDPAVKDVDYTVSKILAEAFPIEVQEIFKAYAAAYAGGQSLVNLQLVQNLAQ